MYIVGDEPNKEKIAYVRDDRIETEMPLQFCLDNPDYELLGITETGTQRIYNFLYTPE